MGGEQAVRFRGESLGGTIGEEGETAGALILRGFGGRGDAKIEKGGAVEKAVRDLSHGVETEPLPVEHRERIRRFYQLLLEGEGASQENGGSGDK